MERYNWHLMLNIDKHTTSYNMYCPYFFIRCILNIMCDSLNTLCCSFLITRSGFVIMRCISYKWCSSLIITCCAFINCRATCYLMYSRYNIIRSIPLIIRCSKFITCCGYIFQKTSYHYTGKLYLPGPKWKNRYQNPESDYDCLVCMCVYSGLTSLSTIFQSYHDGFWLRQGAKCSLL